LRESEKRRPGAPGPTFDIPPSSFDISSSLCVFAFLSASLREILLPDSRSR
jgi:hypothetical protein